MSLRHKKTLVATSSFQFYTYGAELLVQIWFISFSFFFAILQCICSPRVIPQVEVPYINVQAITPYKIKAWGANLSVSLFVYSKKSNQVLSCKTFSFFGLSFDSQYILGLFFLINFRLSILQRLNLKPRRNHSSWCQPGKSSSIQYFCQGLGWTELFGLYVVWCSGQ